MDLPVLRDADRQLDSDQAITCHAADGGGGLDCLAASRAGCEKPLELDFPSGWYFSSRGGTRTRDPGIMSAVL